jgi:tRNA modification GTPase
VLLDQYHGALDTAIDAARSAIDAGQGQRAQETIVGILAFRDLGLHLTTPWRVVIAGPPNVGKSSLLNAIAGYQRAIVSPLPGTTRDVLTITTAIGGWPVRIADTAGLRDTRDELESAGVALAGAAIEQAELVLVVSDASEDAQDATEILQRLPRSMRAMHVLNKVDLAPRSADARLGDASPSTGIETQRVSALTGQGIAELLVAIEHLLVPTAPPAGAAVPFTMHQVAGLESALDAIILADYTAADAALMSVLSTESVAEDM